MRIPLIAFVAALMAAPLAGQTADVQPASLTQEPTHAYAYRPDGRRDPFVSLVGGGGDSRAVTRQADGPAGLVVGEIAVRGVVQSREALVAMVQAPDNRTYLIHQGDRLADGVVKSVTPQGLVIVQDIRDPLSAQKQREVRKLLRSLEDTK